MGVTCKSCVFSRLWIVDNFGTLVPNNRDGTEKRTRDVVKGSEGVDSRLVRVFDIPKIKKAYVKKDQRNLFLKIHNPSKKVVLNHQSSYIPVVGKGE